LPEVRTLAPEVHTDSAQIAQQFRARFAAGDIAVGIYDGRFACAAARDRRDSTGDRGGDQFALNQLFGIDDGREDRLFAAPAQAQARAVALDNPEIRRPAAFIERLGILRASAY
jgi:hypothetical protein